jgi:hypothetical protein
MADSPKGLHMSRTNSAKGIEEDRDENKHDGTIFSRVQLTDEDVRPLLIYWRSG